MKVLIISTTVYPLPPTGYAGTEALVSSCARELQQRGHQVSVVAPEGSNLGEGIEIIPVGVREAEESAWAKYKGRLSEFDIISDHTFESWAYMDSIGVDPPLPIVKTFHTDPSIWSSPPPVPHPCLVGISKDHARRLALRFQVPVEAVLNGIDPQFYTMPPEEGKRNGRLLQIGRYTAEKGALEACQLAKRLRMPLDIFGDQEMVGSIEYVERCRKEADGTIVRCFPGITRQQTVEKYQTYRAFLYLPVWQEPMGLTIVEAQACGLPVFTLSHGSLPELVKHGVTGYACDDTQEVEKRLMEGCWREIKPEACRAWVEERFTVQRMVEDYLRLFERVKAGQPW